MRRSQYPRGCIALGDRDAEHLGGLGSSGHVIGLLVVGAVSFRQGPY
jgi:hypothetical protein